MKILIYKRDLSFAFAIRSFYHVSYYKSV